MLAPRIPGFRSPPPPFQRATTESGYPPLRCLQDALNGSSQSHCFKLFLAFADVLRHVFWLSAVRRWESHSQGKSSVFIAQDEIGVAVQVGMFPGGRLPAIEEPSARSSTKLGFRAVAGRVPIALLGFGLAIFEQFGEIHVWSLDAVRRWDPT